MIDLVLVAAITLAKLAVSIAVVKVMTSGN